MVYIAVCTVCFNCFLLARGSREFRAEALESQKSAEAEDLNGTTDRTLLGTDFRECSERTEAAWKAFKTLTSAEAVNFRTGVRSVSEACGKHGGKYKRCIWHKDKCITLVEYRRTIPGKMPLDEELIPTREDINCRDRPTRFATLMPTCFDRNVLEDVRTKQFCMEQFANFCLAGKGFVDDRMFPTKCLPSGNQCVDRSCPTLDIAVTKSDGTFIFPIDTREWLTLSFDQLPKLSPRNSAQIDLSDDGVLVSGGGLFEGGFAVRDDASLLAAIKTRSCKFVAYEYNQTDIGTRWH